VKYEHFTESRDVIEENFPGSEQERCVCVERASPVWG